MDGPYQFGSASTVLTVIRGRIFQQPALWCSLVLHVCALVVGIFELARQFVESETL
jgi:hypothetical protein